VVVDDNDWSGIEGEEGVRVGRERERELGMSGWTGGDTVSVYA
jgi:hypothetical protein